MKPVQTPFNRIPSVVTGEGTVRRCFSFGNRTIIFLVALCMAANMLAPLSGAGSNGSGLIARLLDNMLPQMRFNATCGLPVTIVSGLSRGENPLTAAFGTVPEDESRQDAPVGYFARDNAGKRMAGAGSSLHDGGAVPGQRSGYLQGLATATDHWPPGLSGFIYLMVLLYLIVLSRSNLPWILVPVRVKNGTRPYQAGFFIYTCDIKSPDFCRGMNAYMMSQ